MSEAGHGAKRYQRLPRTTKTTYGLLIKEERTNQQQQLSPSYPQRNNQKKRTPLQIQSKTKAVTTHKFREEGRGSKSERGRTDRPAKSCSNTCQRQRRNKTIAYERAGGTHQACMRSIGHSHVAEEEKASCMCSAAQVQQRDWKDKQGQTSNN